MGRKDMTSVWNDGFFLCLECELEKLQLEI